MTQLRLLIGHFHPLAVHLPIGIFLLLAVLEISTALSRRKGFAWLPALTEAQRGLILVCAAVASAVTAAMGWMLAAEGGYDPALVHRHRILGVALAALSAVLLLVHVLRWTRARTAVLVLALAALVAAGHSGGSITHGSDFLVQYFPARVRRLLGEKGPAAAKPAAADPARAAAFAVVVQPILDSKCIGCHGPQKTKGDFRCDSWAALMKGGKHGPEIRAGDSENSRLVGRISLPLEEKEHMPPKGKVQLSDDEIALLAWWVDSGAPRDKTLAALDQPPDIARVLSARFAAARPAEPQPDRAATLAAAAAVSANLGIVVRPLTRDGPWLSVNARVRHEDFGDREIAQLAPIAAALYWLDLGGTAVTDRGLTVLSGMRNLRRLDLSRTPVSDAGLARVGALRTLEYLNLYGTAVSDAGLPSLRPLSRLRSLYLWQTRVTPGGIAALAARHTDHRRIQRLESQIGALEDEIRDEKVDYNLGASAAPALAASPEVANPRSPAKPKPRDAGRADAPKGKDVAVSKSTVPATPPLASGLN